MPTYDILGLRNKPDTKYLFAGQFCTSGRRPTSQRYSRLGMLTDRLGIKMFHLKSRDCKERGSVMLEAALLLPLLLLFSLNTFDIGRLLINYMDAVHIVREAVRLGGSTPGLEGGGYDDIGGVCKEHSTATACSSSVIKHRKLHQLIKQIIANSENDFKFNPNEIEILTDYDPNITKNISVTLKFKYHGLFQPFDLINVSTSAVGPFL